MHINTETATKPVRGIPFSRFVGDLNRKAVVIISTSPIAPRLIPVNQLQYAYYLIPNDAKANDLHLLHKYPVLEAIQKDINCAFPIERIRELAESGFILSPTPNHICVDSAQIITKNVKGDLALKIAELVEAEEADAAIVLGAGVLGHRNSAIIQKAIEDRGIPSVTISQYPRLSRLYHVSRIVYPVGFLPGHIVGPPNFAELQREVLRDALELLTTATNPLSILEKEYPQYPVQPIKKRFQFWDQPRYRKNKAAS